MSPLYYDIKRQGTATTSSSTHLYMKTVANQETARITGVYAAIQASGTVGGGIARLQDNIGTTASGGGPIVPTPRNRRLAVASTTAFDDSLSITPGTSLMVRVQVGFAQTGGQNGWVAIEPSAALQLMPNTTNPVDAELTSITTTATQTIQCEIEFCEGT